MRPDLVSGDALYVGHCADCEWPVVVVRQTSRWPSWPPIECPQCGAKGSLGLLINGRCWRTGGEVSE